MFIRTGLAIFCLPQGQLRKNNSKLFPNAVQYGNGCKQEEKTDG
jgi:hypothetical protein